MDTHRTLAWIDAELKALRERSLDRRLRVRTGPQQVEMVLEGRPVLNFGSNDYLALAADPRLAAAVARELPGQGWGSGASPLVTGYSWLQERLELRLAEFERTEAALVFPSGFAANLGTIAALVGPGDTVYADRKNHASLLDGCRLSRADVRVYAHNDCDDLQRLLKRSKGGRKLIVTDTLFSMDGDLAPLGELADLADRYDAMLLVDEAHATGVFGAHGRGLAEHFGVEDRVAVRIGTLSKALGCHGGFVAGSRTLVDWLVHRARPYVFSTAAPAVGAAAAIAALDIVRDEPQRRERVLSSAAWLRDRLRSGGWNIGRSESQVVPVILGPPEQAVGLAARLWERGCFVPAIRPPTVPDGEACLRISLTSGHTPAMLERLLDALGEG